MATRIRGEVDKVKKEVEADLSKAADDEVNLTKEIAARPLDPIKYEKSPAESRKEIEDKVKEETNNIGKRTAEFNAE